MKRDEPVAQNGVTPQRGPSAGKTDHRGKKNTQQAHDQHGQRERADARQAALVAAGILFLLLAGAALAAPLLDGTDFWQDHFASAEARIGVAIYAPLLLGAALVRAWNPLTWESELLARAGKSFAHVALFWWLLGHLLEAPRLGALAVTPLLLTTPLALAFVTRHARRLGTQVQKILATGTLVAAAAGIAIAALLWNDPAPWLLFILGIPFTLIAIIACPWAVREARRITTNEAPDATTPTTITSRTGERTLETHPLDLPAGTLHPPSGTLALIVTLATLAIVLFIVAPGLPLTAPIAWGALVAALPLVARALVARSGIAHPRALPGPPAMRRHEARVEMISDVSLQHLDEALERFLRWGLGRKRLAREISNLLEPAFPDATAPWVETRLARLPRRPWARRSRENALVAMLRHGRLAEEATP